MVEKSHSVLQTGVSDMDGPGEHRPPGHRHGKGQALNTAATVYSSFCI